MIKEKWKRHLIVGSRIVLGLIFFLFGINGLARVIPAPDLGPAAMGFITAVSKSGYFLPVLKAIEVTCGLALLINWYVPLVLLILAPIVIQILLFHVFLEPNGIFLGLIATILLDFLMWNYRSYYRDLLIRNAKPDLS